MSFAAVSCPVDESVDDVGIADDGAEVAGRKPDVVGGEIDLAVVLDA